MTDKLTNPQLDEELNKLDGWKKDESPDSITKSFKFKSFSESWSFMSRIALLAEKMDHHPEWFNVYDRVDIKLSTHDVGGISQKDILMAIKIDAYAKKFL